MKIQIWDLLYCYLYVVEDTNDNRCVLKTVQKAMHEVSDIYI